MEKSNLDIKKEDKKIWHLKANNSTLKIILANQLNISELLAQMLINRGIHSVEEARTYLGSDMERLYDPLLIKDMDKAVRAVLKCLDNGKPILVHGDYDVDGVSATALLVNALHRLGGVVDYYIPQREEGYGLSSKTLLWAAEEGYALVITVDCGTNSVAEANLATELGITLVITDHHEPGEKIPEAEAFVNPKRGDCSYLCKQMAGVGIALKLVQAIYQNMGLPNRAWHDLLDIACLGTVADIVPLIGENRIIVKNGLKQLAVSPNLGLAALKEVCGVANRPVTSKDVGFALAPRLNAAGRVGDSRLGVELLLCPEKERAQEIALALDACNQKRQKLEAQVLEEAINFIENNPIQLQNKVLVLSGENWHAGVIGIVASRLLDRYHRPILMISVQGEEGKGSARSINSFHLYHALENCKETLIGFGGHAKAAGFSIKKENIDLLRKKINNYADSRLSEEDMLPQINIDLLVTMDDLTSEVVEDLVLLEPFGYGNPEPVLATKQVQLLNWRAVGEKKNHLKVKIKGENGIINGIGFDLARYEECLHDWKQVDMAFIPEINEWNGRSSVQVKIKDISPQALIRNNNVNCEYLPEEIVRYSQKLLKNTAMRLSSPDYVLEKLKLYKEKGPVFEKLPEISTDIWQDITWHDMRESPDRLSDLVNVIGEKTNESVVIFVSSAAQVLELSHSIAFKNHNLAHRIAYYCRGMAEETSQYICNLATPDSGVVLITTPTMAKSLGIKDMGKAILYFPPFAPKGLKYASEVAGKNGNLYLMFSIEDISAASKALTTFAPERDCLAALYKHLVYRAGIGRVVELPASELQELLLEDGGARVEDYTLALVMRIFAEIDLLKFGYSKKVYQVKMLPRPSHKMDLDISPTFRWTNDVTMEGMQFISIMVSGNIKYITKLKHL